MRHLNLGGTGMGMGERTQGLRTVRDFIRWGASRFNEAGLVFGHGTDNALDEAAALVLHALHLPFEILPEYLDSRLAGDEREVVTRLLERRIEERVPAAYLTGSARFADLEFYVTPDVLIPRSPLAEIIEQGFEPWLGGRQPKRILDLGTGGGCIAIACAYQFPEAEVDAADISEAALEVARANVARHALQGRVRLVKSDVYQGLDDRRYEIIVSNPPYVGAEEMAALPAEYRYEPALGLAGGVDGLDIARRILRGASSRLSGEGILVVEVGGSAETLVKRFPRVPFVWLDFQRGGDGVFLLTAAQLRELRPVFSEIEE
jgi:ribosomal protein L3 glutamine methyltransferase